MGTPFTPAQSVGSSHPLALMLDPDARAKPSPADQRNAGLFQHFLEMDPPAQFGGWGGDRWAQLRAYRGLVAQAIQVYIAALGAAKVTLYRRKSGPAVVRKATGGDGHFARDDEYEPVGADEHPLAKVLEQPNGEQGAWSIHQELAFLTLQHLLTGDAPVWMPRNGAGKPVRFFSLVGATVQAGSGPTPDYPKGSYQVSSYTAGGFFAAGQLATTARLPAEEVGRLRDYHPWSRNLGMSRLQTGDREIDCLEAITESRWAMFDHGMQLDTYVLLPGASPEECERLQKNVERKYGGAKNARRFAVFGGGGLTDKMAVQTSGQSAREMDYVQSYDQAAGVVYSIFRVPKELMNFGADSNYSKDWAAQQRFYDLGMSPYCRMHGAFLTHNLARPWERTPGELKIEVEPACPKNLETESQNRNTGLQAGAVMVNEWRLANGLTETPDGELPLPAFVAKQQQAVMPQPVPGQPAVGPGGQPAENPAGAGAGAPETGAESTAPVEDTPEAAQASVTGAALQALGVPDTGDAGVTGDEPHANAPGWDEARHHRNHGQFSKAVTVTKPGVGRVERQEGQVWQSGGKWYTKKNGRTEETADPSKVKPGAPQQPGTNPAPVANPVAAAPADPAAHDELAKKFLAGRPSVTQIVPGGKGVPAHAHVIRDGETLRRFFEKGGKLPDEHAIAAAKQVQVPGPQTRATLAGAHQWAAQQAERHADRVAAHFGISRERAHALLTHAIAAVAKHAAKNGGKLGAVTLRNKTTGRSATLKPTTGPTNPAAAGTRPPVAKALGANTLEDGAGGFLVEPGARVRRRKKRVRACVARVLKSLEQEW